MTPPGRRALRRRRTRVHPPATVRKGCSAGERLDSWSCASPADSACPPLAAAVAALAVRPLRHALPAALTRGPLGRPAVGAGHGGAAVTLLRDLPISVPRDRFWRASARVA